MSFLIKLNTNRNFKNKYHFKILINFEILIKIYII